MQHMAPAYFIMHGHTLTSYQQSAQPPYPSPLKSLTKSSDPINPPKLGAHGIEMDAALMMAILFILFFL